MQNFWQAHYKILLIILLKKFIRLLLLSSINFKDDLPEYKCLCFNKNYRKNFDENFKNRFFNTYKLSSYDINKFLLFFLQKGVYLYQYMEAWEKSDETSLPEKFLQSPKYIRYY